VRVILQVKDIEMEIVFYVTLGLAAISIVAAAWTLFTN
jgi:hypothetical protein